MSSNTHLDREAIKEAIEKADKRDRPEQPDPNKPSQKEIDEIVNGTGSWTV